MATVSNWCFRGVADAAFAVAMSDRAHAAVFKVTLNDGLNSATWLQNSDPTPLTYYAQFGAQVPVTFANSASGSVIYMIPQTYQALLGSPINFALQDVATTAYMGAQIFSGPAATPHFSVGTYALQPYSGSGHAANPTLTIAPAAPALLAGGGILAALASLAGLLLARRGSFPRWTLRKTADA